MWQYRFDRQRLLGSLMIAAVGVACSSTTKVQNTGNGGTSGTDGGGNGGSEAGGSASGGSASGGSGAGGSGAGGSASGGGGSTTGTGGTAGSGGSGGAVGGSGGNTGGSGGNPDDACPDGMAYIPAGTYMLESNMGEVEVDAFCIDRNLVTSGQYAACMSCSPTDTDPFCNAPHAFRDNDPANCLQATEAEFYCQVNDKSLPSEEQWEWAARGGPAANTYPWGDAVPSGDDDPARLCWLPAREDQPWPDRPSGTCPVGLYDQAAVHPFGLEDMSGNVWQWTTSQGSSTSNRVVRGGGYDNDDPTRMTTAFRNDVIPATTRHEALGFRCVSAPLE